MKNITVWRMHLKTKSKRGDLKETIKFCQKNNLIGVGWSSEEYEFYSIAELNNYSADLKKVDSKKAKDIKNIIKPITEMKEDDLIWTRLGQDASVYYICRVGKRVWKDRKVTQDIRDYDVANFVEAEWLKVGGISEVPGKVINSLSIPRTVQRINNIENLSKIYWNKLSTNNTEIYKIEKLGWCDFWESIDSDELETLVFLYLQSEKYYIYTGTVKANTAKIEGVLIHKEDYSLCLPQVKRNAKLLPTDYVHLVEGTNNKVVLFTTSEDYGDQSIESIRCLSKYELEKFISDNKELLPYSIRRRMELFNFDL